MNPALITLFGLHGLASSETVGDSQFPVAGNLVIDSPDEKGTVGTYNRITVPMKRIGVCPITRRGNFAGDETDEVDAEDLKQELYAVFLADERYFWQRKVATQINVAQGVTTWAGLISSLETALGISITYDVPVADLGYPHKDLSSEFYLAAPLLDAVARSIVTVFVAELDGTYHLKTWGNSTSDVNATNAWLPGQVAGGVDRFASSTALPSNLDVLFQRHEVTKWPERRHKETVTLDSDGDGSSIACYTTAQARYDEGGSQTNGVAVTNLADEFATFFASHMIGGCGAYPGIWNITPNGYMERMVVRYQADTKKGTQVNQGLVQTLQYAWEKRHFHNDWFFNSFDSPDPPPRTGFWANITAAYSSGYQWEEVEGSGASFTAVTNGYTGTSTSKAYEVNGDETIESGFVVRMHYSKETEGEYNFIYAKANKWIRFNLSEDFGQSTPGEATATVLDWWGPGVAPTSPLTVYDRNDVYDNTTDWRDQAQQNDKGYAVYDTQDDKWTVVELDYEPVAKVIIATIAQDLGQTGQSTITSIDDFWQGRSPGAGFSVHDPLGIYDKLKAGEQVIASYDEPAGRYVVIDAKHSKFNLTVEETDASPTIDDVDKLIVPACTLSNPGAGEAQLSFNEVTNGTTTLTDRTKFSFPSTWTIATGQDICTADISPPVPYTVSDGGTCIEAVSTFTLDLVYSGQVHSSINEANHEINSNQGAYFEFNDYVHNTGTDLFFSVVDPVVSPFQFINIEKSGSYFIIMHIEFVPNDGLQDITNDYESAMGQVYSSGDEIPACPYDCPHTHSFTARGFNTVAYNARVVLQRDDGVWTEMARTHVDFRYLNPFESTLTYDTEVHSFFCVGTASPQNPVEIRAFADITNFATGVESTYDVGARVMDARVTILRLCDRCVTV
jgi:hypothetical protein